MKTFKISFTAVLVAFITFISISTNAEIAQEGAFSALDNCPTASYSIVNNGALAGTPIQFANESVDGNSYCWDFGDGTFSCEENPSHIYNSAGVYTVKLVVIGGGCTVEFIGTEEVIQI